MPIEDLIADTELLRRVLEHYRFRLDNLVNDEGIKPLMSSPLRRYVTFGQSKTLTTQALHELSTGKNANLKLPPYDDLLKTAVRLYVRDLERIREKTDQTLPDIKLAELESDIQAMKQYLR